MSNRRPKPVNMTAAEVQAILREIKRPGMGKSQMRRVIKDAPTEPGWRCDPGADSASGFAWVGEHGSPRMPAILPWQVGDLLWVRETWAPLEALRHDDPGVTALIDGCFYRADEACNSEEIERWAPSIHMPRWASRITLVVTDVRIQRLQDITEEECWSEGIETWLADDCNLPVYDDGTPNKYNNVRQAFQALWGSLAKPGQRWADNPWVAVTTFRPILANVDEVMRDNLASKGRSA